MRKILVLLLVVVLTIPAVGCRQGRLFRGVWWRQECEPVIVDPCAPMITPAPATCSPCAPATTTVVPSTTVVPGPGAYTTPTP